MPEWLIIALCSLPLWALAIAAAVYSKRRNRQLDDEHRRVVAETEEMIRKLLR